MTTTKPLRKLFRSACCEGEKCHCGQPAAAKVEETIFPDDPLPNRHPLTAYVCRGCFLRIMGPSQKPHINERIGSWLSAALDDPNVCQEMKDDIREWFNQTH